VRRRHNKDIIYIISVLRQLIRGRDGSQDKRDSCRRLETFEMIRIPFSGSAIETPRILAATARQPLLGPPSS